MVFIVDDLSVVRMATGTLGIRSDRIFFAANGSVNKTLDKAIPSICVIYVHLEITYSDIYTYARPGCLQATLCTHP